MSEPLAHSGGLLLEKHLRAVAGIAAGFSQAFETAEPTQCWAYLAGLRHDLGKHRAGFQRDLRQSDNSSRSCDVQ